MFEPQKEFCVHMPPACGFSGVETSTTGTGSSLAMTGMIAPTGKVAMKTTTALTSCLRRSVQRAEASAAVVVRPLPSTIS